MTICSPAKWKRVKLHFLSSVHTAKTLLIIKYNLSFSLISKYKIALVTTSPSLSAVDIESVVSVCCNEGNEWGTQRKHCNEYKFNLDKDIVPAGLQGLCLSTVEICCAKQHRIYQCTGEIERELSLFCLVCSNGGTK